jgi:hypothetical protein
VMVAVAATADTALTVAEVVMAELGAPAAVSLVWAALEVPGATAVTVRRVRQPRRPVRSVAPETLVAPEGTAV